MEIRILVREYLILNFVMDTQDEADHLDFGPYRPVLFRLKSRSYY